MQRVPLTKENLLDTKAMSQREVQISEAETKEALIQWLATVLGMNAFDTMSSHQRNAWFR